MIIHYVLELLRPGMLVCHACEAARDPAGQARPLAGTLKALLAAPDKNISPADRRLLIRLLMLQPLNTGYYALAGRGGVAVVRELVGTGRCFWVTCPKRPLAWGPGRKAVASWKHDGQGRAIPVLTVTPGDAIVLPLAPPLYVDEKTFSCGVVEANIPDELAAAWLAQPPLDAEGSARFGLTMSRQFPGAAIPLPGNIRVQEVAGVRPVPCLGISVRDFRAPTGNDPCPGVISLPVVRLDFDYQGHRVPHASPGSFIAVIEPDALRHVTRDVPAELAAARRLADSGFRLLREAYPTCDPETCAGVWVLPENSPLDWCGALRDLFPRLQEEGWRVDFARGRRIAAVADDAWYSTVAPSGRGWFEFEAGIVVDGRRVNLLPVLHRLVRSLSGRIGPDSAALAGRRSVTVPMEDGTLLVLPGRRVALILRNLFELFDPAPLPDNQRVKVSGWRTAELAELEQLSTAPWQLPEALRRLAGRLARGVTFVPRDPPVGMRTELRGYQRVALDWLQFLREHGVGGILADDMGLGKTIEVLALLLAEKQAGRLERPALVVMPTSVLISWQDAIRRFAPGLSALTVHGPERGSQHARIDRHDLVLTTYPILRLDYEAWRGREFKYLILDEAQFIKNPRAQVAQCVGRLKAEHRLCLTGTPMENHLGELWSLFHFLMPGFLGDAGTFGERFRKPIEQGGDQSRRDLLARRTAPFILRRTKQEVARELPPKTEIVMDLELGERQRDLYETIRAAMQGQVRQEIKAKGLACSHIMILSALLKLRQVCCDPRLVDRESRFRIPEDSCKLQALAELLPELIEEGRRVLLFSQFVGMLDLIEKTCHRLKIPYALLTGATRDRAGPVAAFQAGEVPLFLVSLKAGGFGLNLAAADTVIHYDPWWNPAVESQATDRAHRIGQDKPVFIYKLITRGTVETRIMDLQQRKQALVRGILAEQAAGVVTISPADVERLFAPLG
jgi:superfamily II DNA or RNA helicase